ncbi:uncharacterized protein B0P05DRAFT_543497 [Gilbertella persicaria]|uniref:uncharacterized protein n=1 Tax=Gilbertella persicaria TaxID=101096 RepID=UPI00221FF76E|nr:uncharacterized protein B0P05DRAFT_543497 [Gilbertella persicaria]KAI8077959.1 hypothetical protein B0P05DRAFT_543497 [Gilbertella persicaria]
MYILVKFKCRNSLSLTLSLDHILNGTTCQPISLQDFRYYLLNKEHSGENLDFYFWYLDYCKRFNKLPEHEKAKSPPPKERATPASYNLPLDTLKKRKQRRNTNPLMIRQTDPDQPFRDEVNAVLRTFFHVDSYKELNIEGWMSKYTVFYGCQTTHPDVFVDVHEHIYQIMKTSSLKSFIHHALQNMRYSWVILHYVGGVFNFLHLPMILLYTFSNHTSRWYRLTLFPFTFLFALSILSARAAFCTIRAMMKIRMVPMYEIDQYYVVQGKMEKFDMKTDLESQKDMTSVIDPDVLKYTKVYCFFILCCSNVIELANVFSYLVCQYCSFHHCNCSRRNSNK